MPPTPSASEHNEQGNTYFGQGDWAKAAAEFQAACVAAFVYQSLGNSYVRAREAPDMAIIMLILVTLPAFITGIVGGEIWAVLRRVFR